MIIKKFGTWSYLVVGIMEMCKGALAVIACPLFGKLSDKIGRKLCLLVTVTGTTMPVWILVFTSNMWVFTVCMSISGIFSATFPLTFAYISDTVDKQDRAPAYGLALATFGLSFTFGPVAGAYLAGNYGAYSVFVLSLLLVSVDVVYILTMLPETVRWPQDYVPLKKKINSALDSIPITDLAAAFNIFRSSEFMRTLAVIVLLYYSAVWAVVSTLTIHVTRQLHFSSGSVAWMLSGYGLATMFSEAVLVRLVVPRIGEISAMRIGLGAFAVQTLCVAVSKSPAAILAAVAMSMLSNLVYPALSSLMSKISEEDAQGEALGALNGIKAVTEGFGPLLFGSLMMLFEDSPTPGAPYILAFVVACWAFLHSFELPADAAPMAVLGAPESDELLELVRRSEGEE